MLQIELYFVCAACGGQLRLQTSKCSLKEGSRAVQTVAATVFVLLVDRTLLVGC
jgi:hypothetical protein